MSMRGGWSDGRERGRWRPTHLRNRSIEPTQTPKKQATDFCRPPEVAAIQRVLARVADLSITAHGGFPQAERRRVFFARALEDGYDYGGGEEGGGEGAGAKVPEELLPYFQVRFWVLGCGLCGWRKGCLPGCIDR